MDVNELFDVALFHQGERLRNATLEGWLVIINEGLYVLENEYKDPYWDSKKIKIRNSEIIYPVRDKILPLGGGNSFVFHKCRIQGGLVWDAAPMVEVESILVYEKPAGFIAIDISQAEIARCKKKYGEQFFSNSTSSSRDWLDHI
ncbi:MAG: hypothetical protein ACN6OP_10665 [Pseudomonadales bacterium]|uniref:hypothetical protein n=1 Tax=Achromobacter mucicolens TaxID=1389922 RepID=UPI0015CD6146|nr:hypothetical protein [Achromobacter mucicolens]MDG9968243.1 hypothetical protein [Achromobacter mucicolens]